MSIDGAEIADKIAEGIAEGSEPWKAMGDAVAGYLARSVWYVCADAVGAFPQSLVGAAQPAGFIAVTVSASGPATLAHAAMASGMPGLALWPAQTMALHLWVHTGNLPEGSSYGVTCTLLQVDDSGDVVATLGQHLQPDDPYYSGDVNDQGWNHRDLFFPIPQMAIAPSTRLAFLLQAWTTSVTPVVVDLGIGGSVPTNIETSLVAAAGTGGGTTILDSPDGSIIFDPDGEIDGTGGGGGVTLPIAESDVVDLVTDLAGKLSATDPSVTNARAPTAHAATHASAGSDPITVAESQVTNLTTDLAAKEPALGTPSVTGYVLSSTTGGARSWVAQSGGGGASNWDGGQANSNYGGTLAINGGTA